VRAELGRAPALRVFVVCQAQAGTMLARDAGDVLAELGQVAPVVLGMRVAYSVAMASGESVLTTDPSGAAADEVAALRRSKGSD
jgi:hypothetical protein